jgi:glutamate synthase (NADPH) small chain
VQQQKQKELESLCIQDQAPWCTASCPIHVNVRGIVSAISQGDFKEAYKILRKAVPFPGIVSWICDQPCQQDCKRDKIGGAIEIALLERACVNYGSDTIEPFRVLPRKSKRVAIIGSGLSGLTVAYDLARKGYGVSIYEANHRIGGNLWQYPQDRLPASVIQEDLSIMEVFDLDLHLNTKINFEDQSNTSIGINELIDEFDAIYIGVGSNGRENLKNQSKLSINDQGFINIDEITRMTNQEGIYAGGGIIQSDTPSPIQKISAGRRAATSIDRYLQKVSITASRYNEGGFESKLYTNISGINAKPSIEPSNFVSGYTQNEAISEAERCILCECLECVKVCEYLHHYGSYPKQYLREIYNNLAIVMGMRNSNQFINSCSLCNLCVEVCPTNLSMAEVIHTARQTMVEQKRMPPSAHDFALKDMQFSNGDAFTLIKHAPRTSQSAYALFPGCQLCASSPAHVHSLYEKIIHRPNALDEPVGLILQCCGAPADWAGRMDFFEQSQKAFYDAYHQLGDPILILACPSCYRAFRMHYADVKIISLWEWLEREELIPTELGFQHTTKKLTIHDACATRYESAIHESIRRILDQIGIQVEEAPLNREKSECCSFGGVMWLANPSLAHQVVDRQIQANELDFITYCAMCRDFFVRQGKPALHILDLLFGVDPTKATQRPDPGFSVRRENRRYLKRKILEYFWEETMEPLPEFTDIRIFLSDGVKQICEQRLILQEELQQVIAFAEANNQKLLNKTNGHILAYHKLGNVTYWVEYLSTAEPNSKEQLFPIFNAYSHRMEIEGKSKR